MAMPTTTTMTTVRERPALVATTLAKVATTALALLASCTDGSVPDQALDARLRVSGGQFFRGDMPAPEDGPAVKELTLSPIVRAGSVARTCSGVIDPSATAVALALEGDRGYWIVPAGIPDVTAQGFPTFKADLAFALSLAPGRRAFLARAVDGGGRFGAAFVKPLDVTAAPRPTGRLVIALSWDAPVDLDLHVVDPNGVEIWKRNISSYEPPPPGSPPEPPGTPHPGGVLDFDSNAQCVPDGRRAENVVYADAPPSGHYVARVDTFSLCKEVGAHWRVEAFLDGVSVAAAEGASAASDTRFAHDRGAGVLALEIDVP
jgi:hypothetical protein